MGVFLTQGSAIPFSENLMYRSWNPSNAVLLWLPEYSNPEAYLLAMMDSCLCKQYGYTKIVPERKGRT